MQARVTLTRDHVHIRSLANQISTNTQRMILLMIMMNLLDKLWIIPEDSIVETGAIASSFIENIDVSSLLHQQPGTVQVTLGQSVV